MHDNNRINFKEDWYNFLSLTEVLHLTWWSFIGSILIPSLADGGVDVNAARSAFEMRHVSKLLSLPGVSSLPKSVFVGIIDLIPGNGELSVSWSGFYLDRASLLFLNRDSTDLPVLIRTIVPWAIIKCVPEPKIFLPEQLRILSTFVVSKNERKLDSQKTCYFGGTQWLSGFICTFRPSSTLYMI